MISKLITVFFKKFTAYIKDEDGQTSTEYILLLAVVAMIVFRFRSVATQRLEALTEGVFGRAEELLEEDF